MPDDKRKGDYMTTYTGVKFWPLDPRVQEIRLEDIAHALSRICRFNGHVRSHYSVAQHAVLVSHLVPKYLALEALHHDDAEAYLADLVRPVKRHIPKYMQYERELEQVISDRFRLSFPLHSVIHDIDTRIVADEAEALFLHVPSWTKDYQKIGVRIRPVPAFIAKRLYLHRHRELNDRRYERCSCYERSLTAWFWRLVTRFIL